jgi:NAD-dependent dihydropyrimidine dehydrogenase PreA subunit
MKTRSLRKIVRIDQEKCDGCGQCVPSCAEGAIQMINGKACLMGDNLCDGLGACLGHCPRGAITVEERQAEDFDEQAVHAHLARRSAPAAQPPARRPMVVMNSGHGPAQQGHHGHHGHQASGGCPGSRLRVMAPAPRPAGGSGSQASRLGQWPVQLALVPPTGPLWQDADVLIAADCVPFAMADFHEGLLAGRRLAIACPKLDDVQPYVQKLAQIFSANAIRSVTVAIMEVPCCGGLLRVVQAALALSGRDDIQLKTVVVGTDGVLRN